MIKRLAAFFTVICLLSQPIFAFADVVFGNDFFYKNESETEKIGERHFGKKFIANSPLGYIIPKEEPGSEQGILTATHSYKGKSPGGREDEPYTYNGEVFVFINGEIINITHIYLHNERYWGIMPPSHTYQPPGWILMEELLVLYDCQDFEVENKDNFYPYTGSYDAVLSAERLIEWEWPGSDKEKMIIEDYISERANVLYAYKDIEGREWGKTKYSERWICLNEPENSKIPSFYPALQPTEWSPDGSNNWSDDITIYPPAKTLSSNTIDNMSNIIILFIILLSVVSTIIVIMIFGKRNKNRREEK